MSVPCIKRKCENFSICYENVLSAFLSVSFATHTFPYFLQSCQFSGTIKQQTRTGAVPFKPAPKLGLSRPNRHVLPLGWAEKKSWKKRGLNSWKTAQKQVLKWISDDKGHQKVNIHKTGFNAVMNCLLSLNWPMLHQTLLLISCLSHSRLTIGLLLYLCIA